MAPSCSNCGFVEAEPRSLLDDVQAVSSSFHHLLQTNDPPSDSDASRLLGTLLKDAAQEIDDLDKEVDRLLTNARAAQKRRRKLQSLIDNYKSIISPLRRFPTEVLAEIFLWTPKSLPGGYHYDVFDVTAGPWVVSQVCRRWRSMALSCSAMWSSMSLQVSEWQDFDLKDPISLVNEALHRSGGRDLRFQLDCRLPQQVQQDMLEAFARHAPRWKDVDLRIPPALLPVLNACNGSLPLLSKLRIDVDTAYDSGSVLHASEEVIAFQQSQHLRSITIDGFRSPETMLKLPWTQLTSIEIYKATRSAMKTILQAVPSLEDLVIEFEESDGGESATIVHPSLRKLALFGGGTMPSDIVLPALADIFISRNGEPGLKCHIFALRAVNNLVGCSHCNLSKISFRDVLLNDEVASLLRETPTVTSLCVGFSYFEGYDDVLLDGLIRLLTYTPPAPSAEGPLTVGPVPAPILPNLEVLDFNVEWLGDMEEEVQVVHSMNNNFVRLVDSRRTFSRSNPPVTALRRVDFNARGAAELPNISDVDIAALKSHKANGLEINIWTLTGETTPSGLYLETFSITNLIL